MSQYDNPRMINDPRAAAAANVGAMFGNMLSNVGKRYYDMREKAAKKAEKIEEFNQRTRNSIELKMNSDVVKFGEQLQLKNIPQDMWDKQMEYQRTLVTAAKVAQYDKMTGKNLTEKEILGYDKTINIATDNVAKVLSITGNVGAEIKQIQSFFDNGENSENQIYKGFNDGSMVASNFTGASLIGRPVPGVSTEFTKDGAGSIFTHTVAKNLADLKGMEMISDPLSDVTIKSDGDNWVITQILDENFDIITDVSTATDHLTVGQEGGVLDSNNKINADILFNFPQVNRLQPDENGNVLKGSRIIGSKTSFLPNTSGMTSSALNAKATAISKQDPERIAAYILKRHQMIVDAPGNYPDFFDLSKTTKAEQIEILNDLENVKQLQTIAGVGEYEGRRITEAEIDKLYTAKAAGDKNLQYLPLPGTAEFKAWKEEQHYFKTDTSSQGTYNPLNVDDWDTYDRTWLLDANYGLDSKSTSFYVPKSGVKGSGKPGEPGYIAPDNYVPATGIENAKIIMSNPGSISKETYRIVQTGKEEWLLQKQYYDNGNYVFFDIGKPGRKRDFDGLLGLKTK